MGDSADRRIACGIGMFERHFLGPIGHGEPAALDERKFASGSAPSEPGPEGTGSQGGSADASASSSSSAAAGPESPTSGSDPSAGTDDKSRDDLTDEQIAPWSRFEQIAPNRLRFYFPSGTERCYGTRVAVKETDTSVEVATIIGRLPNAPRECTLELRKASVTVKTDKPIGERKVRRLEGIQLH